MIRRTVLAVAAAAALILTPSVTMAQAVPLHTGVVALPQVVVGFTCTVSTSTPKVGAPVTVLCTGGHAYQTVTLRVDGIKAVTKQLSSRGAGTFSVKFTAPATHTLTMTNVAGTVLFKKVVRVGFTCSVSTSTPAAGAPVKVLCSGGNAYQSITPKVDGTKLFTQKLDSKGQGTFTVRIQRVGTHTLTMNSSVGKVLFTARLVVHAKVVFKCTLSTRRPAAGELVTLFCSGGSAGKPITLRVDGGAPLTQPLNAKGQVTFPLRFKTVGKHTLKVTNSAGTVLFTANLMVHPKYPASRYSFTVTDSTPSAGVPFTANMTGGPANTAIVLTVTSNATSTSKDGIAIAGTKSITRIRNANSEAAFAVTLTEAGAYTLVVTNSDGVSRGAQTVTVAAAPAAAPAATVGLLSRTGFDPLGLLVGGGLLLLAGTGAVLAARRRKSAQVSV